jgi:glycosyltransferase involved in cell wall biosynthesis/uncharacterized protein YbdZ (MbtH family)
MNVPGSIQYKVVQNPTGQYAIWPVKQSNPSGWIEVGKVGLKDDCLTYIEALHSNSAEQMVKGDYANMEGERNTDHQPLVSIIMPTFNREKLLSIAIKSVTNQIYSNWELLVVDDRSTDNTKALIQEYASKDQRIKYFVNERKKGPSCARNYGIQIAKGDYIAFLDSDDEWLEHHLSESIKVLTHENVCICLATFYERINGKLYNNEDRKNNETFEIAQYLLKPQVSGEHYFFDESFFEYNIIGSFSLYHINTLVIAKKVLTEVGLFNEKLSVNEDTDFLHRAFHGRKFCFINHYHFIYNYGNDNLYAYADHNELRQSIFENEKLLKKLLPTLKNRVIAFQYRKNLVRNSTKIKNKVKCLELLDMAIARTYVTLGYVFSNRSRIKSLFYYLKSLVFYYKKSTLIFIGKLLFPFYFRKFNINEDELSF